MSGPIVIDTDIGGDPDDAVALAVAAGLPELALVTTSDEWNGERARFARYLLDQLDRADVPVREGADLGKGHGFLVGGITSESVPRQEAGLVEAVAAVCAAAPGLVRWVGIGALSNLATVLSARPELGGRIAVTQMGGAVRYRDPGRAEHNFRLDPAATRAAVSWSRPRLVTSDVTFTSEIEITRASPIYHALAASTAPAWAVTLRTHLNRWIDSRYPGSMQHDPLTLSVALGLPFVSFETVPVRIDDQARMSIGEPGVLLEVSRSVDYPAFRAWLAASLDLLHS